MSAISFGARIIMNELKEYYVKKSKKTLECLIPIWIVLMIIFYFVGDNINNCLYTKACNDTVKLININNYQIISYIIQCMIGFLSPTGIVIFLYDKYLNYIDKKGWKKKFPDYNIDGEWYDKTVYTKRFDSNGSEKISKFDLPSKVVIHQTCRELWIDDSPGEFFNWHSLSADLQNLNLRILYRVNYQNGIRNNSFPEFRIGYEDMHIVKNSENQKPVLISGKFWHCVSDDDKPMYMGNVEYTRNLTN